MILCYNKTTIMKAVLRIVITLIAQALALYLAARLITGFEVSGGWKDLFFLALILAILNFILKPILKLILGPVILLTLGIGLIAVNALVLYALDFLSPALTIHSATALVLGTFVVSIVNAILHVRSN